MEETTKYIAQNNTYSVDGNENADKLFCMLESQSILSEKLHQRPVNILFWILTNHKSHKIPLST